MTAPTLAALRTLAVARWGDRAHVRIDLGPKGYSALALMPCATGSGAEEVASVVDCTTASGALMGLERRLRGES